MLAHSDVFICGYYGFGNTGDELILAAILRQLRDRIIDCKVTVMSGNPDATAERFGVRAIHWRDPDAMLRAVEYSRLVVIGGGGLFHDYAGAVPDAILTSSNAGIGLHAAVALAASLLNKPLLLWNLGVGPLFSQHGRDLVRYIANAASAITVRDAGSAMILRELGIEPDRIVLAADPIFASIPPESCPADIRAYFQQIEEGSPVIGVALRYWDRGADLDYWTRQVAEGLDAMSSRTGARFVFIPLQAEEVALEDDTLIARKVASQMTLRERTHVLEAVLDPEETWSVLASCDVVLGMRLHAVLLAACSGVPAVSLSYDPKGSSAADELGLKDFELPLGSITADRIASLLESLAARGENLRAGLQVRCAALRERAIRTADIAQALLTDAAPVSQSPADPKWLYSVVIKAQARAGAAAETRVSELEGRQRELVSQAGEQATQLEAALAASRAEVECLRTSLAGTEVRNEHESARWKSEIQAVEESLAEAEQSREQLRIALQEQQTGAEAESSRLTGLLKAATARNYDLERQIAAKEAALESAHAALGLMSAAGKQKAEATEIELGKLRESKAELRAWTEQQAAHIHKLAAWTQKQAAHIESLQEQIVELQTPAKNAASSYEPPPRRLAMGPVRRAAHLALDGLQVVIPEHVRERVRPVYLPLYRRWFPTGQPARVQPPPAPRLPAGLATLTAESQPPVSIPKVAPKAVLAKSPLPASDYAPKVTVVLPVWNHSGLLVGSIRSVLAQTWQNLELIIVDDGSDADLIAPIREAVGTDSRVRVLRRPHEGLPQTLSAGFRFATGEFFTWTSADNVMKPDMIETLVGFLLRRPDVDMTYADMDLIGPDGLPLFDSDYRVTAQRPGANNELSLPRTIQTLSIVNDNFVGACFLYRAEMGRILGDYDATRLGTEDYDYWLRLSALGRIEHLDSDRCLYSYRVHTDSISGRHTPAIAKNAVQLVDFHRERMRFFERPFSIAIMDRAEAPFSRVFAAALRHSGHTVTLIGETDSERGYSAVERWWSDARAQDRQAKGLLVCCDSAPEWLGDFDAQFADQVAMVVRAGASNSVDLARTGLDPVWALCSSSRQTQMLPPPLTNSWSVFPDSAVDFEDLLISLKARDNFSQLWDVPSFDEPLIVYAGPIDDRIIDWTAVQNLMAAQPAATILFIASDPQNATDPRSRVTQSARVKFLGVKRATEWHPYFSRAALLIAPLLKTVEAETATYNLMVAFVAAGKPILASEAIGPAGFQDAPNAVIAASSNFGEASARALQMEPDLEVADRYLARKAPRALAAQIVAVANDRLFRRQSEDSGPRTRSHAAAVGRQASLPTILLETDSMHRGGLERVVLDMARTLQSRRYRVALAITGHAGDMAAECRASGIAVHEIGRDRTAYERLLTAESPDLVIPHYSNFGAPLAWKRGIPVLSFIHNSYIWTTDEVNKEIRETDLFVTHYVAVSKEAARFFSRKFFVPEQKITCIPNGIDLHGRDEPAATPLHRADLGLHERDFVVVCVASIVGTKAQIHAIAAVDALRREIPNLRLILVGGEADAAYSSLVREFIREAALQDSVFMTGHTDTVGAYYGIADAFLLSSLTEGWSLAKTEAMFHGLPLILTEVGGAAQVIENGDIGILVPPAYDDPLQVNASNLARYCSDRSPRNLGDLTQALRTMYRDRDSWREKGKLGREKVLRAYDCEIIAERHCREIDRILSCHGYAESGYAEGAIQAAALSV